MGLGGGVASPSVNDYILASEVFKTPTDSKLIEDLASSTKLRFFARYSNHVGLDLSEVGLFWLFDASSNYWGLLARSLVSPPITIPSLSDRSDAYTLEFSAGYTRWFVRALVCAMLGNLSVYSGMNGMQIRMIDGNYQVVRATNTFQGSNDLQIGSDNTAPAPTDYYLKAYTATLGSQTQGVEVDTALNEVRVIRSGTITPASDMTLGEIAWLTNVYDRGGTARTIMLARGIWSPAVILSAGVSYTLGLVLKL
jgi:hypothetical protein